VSIFIAVITGPLILLAGLLTVDAFGALRTRERADALAIEAARAAQQAVDLDSLIPSKGVRVEPAAASAAARTYLSRAGARGTVRVSDGGRTVTVTVTGSYSGVFWPHTYHHSVSSTATLLYGTTQPEDGKQR
jgi:Flp pilus assembly protein TadG